MAGTRKKVEKGKKRGGRNKKGEEVKGFIDIEEGIKGSRALITVTRLWGTC